MSKIESIWQQLIAGGKAVSLSEHGEIPLPEAPRFYAIKNTRIDLYFTPTNQVGPRFFLLSFAEGIFLPLRTSEEFQLIAISHADGEVFDCTESSLSQIPSENLVELFKEFALWFWRQRFQSPNMEVEEMNPIWDLMKENRLSEAKELLSQHLHLFLADWMREKLKEDIKTLKERDVQAEKNLAGSLEEMHAVLARSFPADEDLARDPLFFVFQRIGKALRFSFTFPKYFPPEANLEEKIERICKASDLCFRKVRLRGMWWKQDLGPLLGVVKEDQSPCALLCGEYFLGYKKIQFNREEKVSEKISDQMLEMAYMFYVPFPASLKSGKEVIRFLWTHTWPHWRILLLFSFLGMGIALFPALAAYILFNYAIGDGSISLVGYLGLGLFFSTLGVSLFYFIRNYAMLKIEGIGVHLVQSAIWDRLLKLGPSFFRRFSIGNLYWRVLILGELRSVLSNTNLILVINGVFSVLYFIVMLSCSYALALVAFAFSLAAIGITFVLASRKMKYLGEYMQIQGTLQGLVLQMIRGVGKLRIARAEKSAFAYWASHFAKAKVWQMKSQLMQNFSRVIVKFFPILSMGGIYMAMVYWIGIHQLPLPLFIAFNIAWGNFAAAFYPALNAITEIAGGLPYWSRTKEVLEEPIEDRGRSGSSKALGGHVRMDNIYFSYAKDTPNVLEGISLEVHPGEYVAIVGKSGSGKSTLARLLLGFEKPRSGSIYFDGQDLAHLDLREVRRQIGTVLQDNKISGGSIYDNLVCGGSYSVEQIEQVLKMSGFEKDLSSFPMGLNTIVPSGGETFSGGQKQRLLLARAFLSNPAILIFDEATSALDNETQEEVSRVIDGLKSTRIIIAQRLRTIQKADRIYVIHEGKIAEAGTFEELVGAKGLFAEMSTRQKL